MKFAELAVEDFDEHADLQSKMWNQFMRKKEQSMHEDRSLLDGVSILFLFLKNLKPLSKATKTLSVYHVNPLDFLSNFGSYLTFFRKQWTLVAEE